MIHNYNTTFVNICQEKYDFLYNFYTKNSDIVKQNLTISEFFIYLSVFLKKPISFLFSLQQVQRREQR